ncbi:unnamed protein product [Caenorhabditis auriculariae]|uniref:Ubiquitin-like domain-containing protein n=1 Tax=Caenorhabditis auriculariae TaxID=2777116 RepID=A0A8S1H4J9_9PELO|nr:unnamed protein product [Caenorhabditis auriculariae]
MEISLILTLHDQGGVSHCQKPVTFPDETTIKELSKAINSFWSIHENYQELYHKGKQIISLKSTLRQLHFKDDDVIVVKHAALKCWVNFLSHCDVVNDTKADRNDRKASAYLAIDLSAQLESSKFLLAYADFGTTWVQKRGQALRLIDRLLPAFKESAKAFFASLDPESTVEFEPKTVGIMSGTIAKVNDAELQIKIVVEAYILRLILGITDLNSGNFWC